MAVAEHQGRPSQGLVHSADFVGQCTAGACPLVPHMLAGQLALMDLVAEAVDHGHAGPVRSDQSWTDLPARKAPLDQERLNYPVLHPLAGPGGWTLELAGTDAWGVAKITVECGDAHGSLACY